MDNTTDIEFFPTDDKGVRVDNDLAPATEVIEVQIEYQQTGVCGDIHTHGRIDAQATGAGDGFFMQEEAGKPAQTMLFLVVEER
jgi:hypothetical protein